MLPAFFTPTRSRSHFVFFLVVRAFVITLFENASTTD
jgi:hypothetical protein